VAVNAPDDPVKGEKDRRPGHEAVRGRALEAKVIDLDTGQPVHPARGMLLLRGANLMVGYLKAPEKTREVLRDGWYVTGDVATIDEDGFIRLTDRPVALQQDRR